MKTMFIIRFILVTSLFYSSLHLFNGIRSNSLIVDSKIEKLLPSSEHSDAEKNALTQLTTGIDRKAIVLFTTNAEQTEDSYKKISQALSYASKHFQRSEFWSIIPPSSVLEEHDSYLSHLSSYRFQLLSPHKKNQLNRAEIEHEINRNLQSLYQPGGWQNPLSFSDDPLNIFGDWIDSLNTKNNLSIFESGITGQKNGHPFGALIIEINEKVNSINSRKLAVKELDSFSELIGDESNLVVHRSGVIFHTNEATNRAKREISIISIGTITGIILLYLFVFRSFTPLAISIGAICLSLVNAISFTHSVFGSVHIISLVFGASLIGVSIDYSIHFFSSLYIKSSRNDIDLKTPLVALRKIFPAITLALITTSLGYLCLTQSGLSILAQVAVFSTTGLTTAWLLVTGVYTFFSCKQIPIQSSIQPFAQLPFKLWQGHSDKMKVSFAITILFILVLGFLNLTISRDIRTLHKPSKEVVESMQGVGEYFSSAEQNTFLLISGNSPDEVLRNEEFLTNKLITLLDRKYTEDYISLSRHIPSLDKQQTNYHHLQSVLDYSINLEPKLIGIGVSEGAIEKHIGEFRAAENNQLTLNKWLEFAPSDLKKLWLGKVNNQYYSVIQFIKINNLTPLEELAESNKNVTLVSRIDDISTTLQSYTHRALLLLIITFVIAALVLCIYYKKLHSTILILPPLAAASLVIALLNLMNIEITLFHVFGLFLVLGLGIDYTLFLHETYNRTQGHHHDTQTAVLLSVITSGLSFGLMSLSSTPMIHAFGMTILVGSCINFLTAPLVIANQRYTDGS